MALTDIEIGHIKKSNLSFSKIFYMKQLALGIGSQSNVSPADRAKGITPKMEAYCRSQGIDDIPDLDVVWKITKRNNIWRVGKRREED